MDGGTASQLIRSVSRTNGGAMKRALLTLLWCALSGADVAVLHAQGSIDQLSSTVVFLKREDPDTVTVDGQVFEVGLRKPGEQQFQLRKVVFGGSGVLVVRGETRPFLVTAKHVAQRLGADAQVSLRGGSGDPLQYSLGYLVGGGATVAWRHDTESDVSVVELHPTPALASLLSGHFIPLDSLAADLPSRDVSLVVLGFPLTLGAAPAFSPLSRETRAASGRIVNPKIGPVFLLQDPSVGGYSGAPVFDIDRPVLGPGSIGLRPAKLLCVGIISSTLSDDTGGKFGAVVPSSAIRAVIEKVE